MRGFPIAATSVSSEITTGPTHGAATIPTNRPMVAAPRSPARPCERLVMKRGTWISNAPNIDDARISMRIAKPISTYGSCSHAPNILPPSAAITPSAEYITTSPRTYMAESAKRRERRPSLCIAKKPIVIGTIGRTQGVRFSARPPRKSTNSVSGRPLDANVAARRSFGCAWKSLGAAESGTNPVPACGAAPATGVASISAFAVLGGRQMLSLHA